MPPSGASTVPPRPERARRRSRLLVGCSGWNYASWRGNLYPEGVPARRWLELYAERFGTVEINNTFYRLPRREAVARWVEQTPPAFLFAVKASRYLTHVKRLTDLGAGVGRFYERIEPLRRAGRLAVVLWQLPATFHRDERRLAETLACVPEGRHAFEFRHPSWFTEPVYEILHAHDAALVLGDHPQRPFQTQTRTAGWAYLRFHYGRRGRRGNYSDTELRGWAELLRGPLGAGEVFAYFNNDWEGFAPRNAARMRELLASREG
jgi:uncharacterized protein YecE (DUF72 family)